MIKAQKLGLAGGILCGAWMFIMTIAAMKWGFGAQMMTMMMDMYPGYTVTAGGSIVGLIYGFVDGFISLFILGWLYNKL